MRRTYNHAAPFLSGRDERASLVGLGAFKAMLPMRPKGVPKVDPGPDTAGRLSRLVGAALDLLFPPNCAVCGREGRFICEACEVALPKLQQPYCSMCASPGSAPLCSWCTATAPASDGISAPFLMEGAVRDMVYGLKYRNLRASAPALARLMAAYLESGPPTFGLLVPVPLHRRRERERGYNQSELLARELCKSVGIPLETRLLRRTRNTPPQVSMKSPDERRLNIEGAFECARNLGAITVLVVDDVVTTGSTISSCAGALKAAGASSVYGLALARQP